MTISSDALADYGWHQFFAAQLDDDDTLAATQPVRVTAVHRDRLHVVSPGLVTDVRPLLPAGDDEAAAATVGDWLLLERGTLRPVRVLQRRSLFKRRAPGTGRQLQLIAANIDTLLVVTSCNQDLNIARLERYLALAREADVQPVVVLTKADLHDDPADLATRVRSALRGVLVEVLDARDRMSTASLAPWCGRGQTVALVGSSGVGKSTLVNTLTGMQAIATQGIREDDAKGRHTTTGRAMHRLAHGGWLLDTPGMRELQLTDAATGIDDVFSDLAALGKSCRFRDCRHESEPGCAVTAAIAAGACDPARLQRWRKLSNEDARNSATLAERRAQDRAFGRLARRIMTNKHARRR